MFGGRRVSMGPPGDSGKDFQLISGLLWVPLSDPGWFSRDSWAPFSIQNPSSNSIACFWVANPLLVALYKVGI